MKNEANISTKNIIFHELKSNKGKFQKSSLIVIMNPNKSTIKKILNELDL